MIKFKSVEAYISTFPENVQELLEKLRSTIKQTAPKAEELISYHMPAFKMNGMLVYYAAYKKHIGFYPTSSPIKIFIADLVKYKTSKGAIQFPIEKGIPVDLVKKIVKFRIHENAEKVKAKSMLKNK